MLFGRCSALFQCSDLCQSALVAFLAGEPGSDECDDDLFCQGISDDSSPEAEHVHVVMLDALSGRVRVVADGCADPMDLVRCHARSNPTPAYDDSAIGVRIAHCPGDGRREVRIVVIGIEFIRSEIIDFVSKSVQPLRDTWLHWQPGMVCA